MTRIYRILAQLFASRAFFVAIIVFFTLQALWFVFSAVYPMAFDEDFHFGIIQIYANQWSPFLMRHPEGGDAFGAVARDPSYLFHYLMSFPYRLVAHFTDSQTTQVIVLRCMNVAMFVYALFVFRRVLQRITHSNAFTNVALAILTLVPIIPQLAAHVNYDNLLMILVGWACLLVTDIHRQFNVGWLEYKPIILLLTVCLTASIVKYAFLPMFIGIVIFVLYDAYRNFANRRVFGEAAKKGWDAVQSSSRVWLLVGLVAAGGLFFQRFGVNMISYHTPIPSCEKVISEAQCSAYGPWYRDHLLGKTKSEVVANPVKYTYSWVKGLWWRLFFAVNSSHREYTNYPPLPLPSRAALVLAAGMFVLTIVFARRIFKQPLVLFCGIVIIVYCLVLWLENFAMYRETGQPVAINGRYLIPALPLMAIVGWRTFTIAFKNMPKIRPFLAATVLLCFLHGGGVMTFIMRSDETWYWQNKTAISMNQTAQRILDPFIIEGSKKTDGKQP